MLKHMRRFTAALVCAGLCLSAVPLQTAAVSGTLAAQLAAADAARTDYTVTPLDFPQIDRSDMTEGMVQKLDEDRYAMLSWGYFHAEDYSNTAGGRGPYYTATAIVDREGELIVPWQMTMSGSTVTWDSGVYSIVYTRLNERFWEQHISRNVSEFYDAQGNVLFAHEPFAAASPMTDGAAWVAYPVDGCDYPQVQVIDRTGAVQADFGEKAFAYIHSFSEGLANYSCTDEDGTHYGYFDTQGNILFETDTPCGDFHNGLAWVLIDGKYGFLDTAGTLVIPAQYDAIGDWDGFTEESILVKQDGKWAVMDTAGRLLTDFLYEEKPMVIDPLERSDAYGVSAGYDIGCYPFTGGYAQVYQDGKYYLIDTKGRALWEGSETPVFSYGDGLFGAGTNDFDDTAAALLDIHGETILSMEGTGIATVMHRGDGVFWGIAEDGSYQFFEVLPAAELAAGDLDGDGAVNAKDASTVLAAAARLGSGAAAALTPRQQAAADVNADGEINAVDSSVILNYAAAVGSGRTSVQLQAFAG